MSEGKIVFILILTILVFIFSKVTYYKSESLTNENSEPIFVMNVNTARRKDVRDMWAFDMKS